MSDKKRVFKDLVQYEPYECLNSEITGDYNDTHAVKCVNGIFVGTEENGVASWLGIPYAKSPVGKRRFKAPEYVDASDRVFEAKYYGKCSFGAAYPDCIQKLTSEDCLYLNIWVNTDDKTAKKPVMVWIHGGAYVAGSGSQASYSGANLVQKQSDIILVNINYRLNMYGFMDFSSVPGGENFKTAPCNGLLDQAMALRWVHENIAAFGGDPDNVTIFGESAGGSSCTLISLVKGSHKYFKRVITQSGTPAMTRSKEESIVWTNEVMKELGCKTVADLQKVAPEVLTETVGRMFGIYQVLGFRVWPERDGEYLPEDPWEAYANGSAKDIDYLVGCNKDEMNVFAGALGVEGWNLWANDRVEKKSKLMTDEENALVESYLNSVPGEDWEKTTSLFTQSYFHAPAIRLSENQTKAGGKVYSYLFTPEASVPMVKSGHAIEQSAVFGHPELSDLSGRAFDATFTKTMRKLWVQFAKTGNPSLSADISPDGKAKEWPLYDLDNKQVMVLDEFNIHPEKESERKIVDWERTYFLTKYYMH